MGMRRLRPSPATFTCQDWLLFCFVLGIFGGTMIALTFGGPAVQGSILGVARTTGIEGEYGSRELLGMWRQKALETRIGWLAEPTVYSQMLFGFLTFYAGMSPAVVMSVLIMQKRTSGTTTLLSAVFSHGLVYLMIWYVLPGWSGQFQKELHILPGTPLAAMAGVETFLEVYIPPSLTGLL